MEKSSSEGGGACRGPVPYGQINFAGETPNSASSKPDHRAWATQEALECSWNLQRTRDVSSCKKRPPATLSLNMILLNAILGDKCSPRKNKQTKKSELGLKGIGDCNRVIY